MYTYVKVYGPPLLEALDQLRTIATSMPNVTHFHLLSQYLDFVVPNLDTEAMEDAAAFTTHPMDESARALQD